MRFKRARDVYKRQGHASIKTTMDRYVHVTTDSLDQAVRQFESKGFSDIKLNAKMAVSYTHLDVYKRQILPICSRMLVSLTLKSCLRTEP